MNQRPFRIFFIQDFNNERFYALPFVKGLKQAGAEVYWNDYQPITPDLITQIKSINPDFVLFYGFTYKSLVSSDPKPLFCDILHIPYVTYFCDNPLRYLPYLPSPQSTPLHRIFCCDSHLVTQMHKAGFSNTWHLPLSFDPDIDYPGPKTAQYEHDLVFSGTVPTQKDLAKRRQSWPPQLVTLFNQIVAKRQSQPGTYLDYSREIQKNVGTHLIPSPYHIVFSLLSHELVFEFKRIARSEMFSALQNHDLHVYGATPDSQHPESKWTGHEFVDQHTTLPHIYRSAKINLCLELLPASCHQRVFEASGCQGLILSENRQDTHTLFDVGKETLCFSSQEDLKDKVSWLLKDSQARNKIAFAGYKRAKHCHTVKTRGTEFLTKMREIL